MKAQTVFAFCQQELEQKSQIQADHEGESSEILSYVPPSQPLVSFFIVEYSIVTDINLLLSVEYKLYEIHPASIILKAVSMFLG